jgi:NAD-dependent deacetylase
MTSPLPAGNPQFGADLERIGNWLARAERCVVFTGAGVSTESGIPDFRSPGGVWSRTKPILFDDYRRDPQAQLEYWRQRAETQVQFADAQPNTAHLAFARWEAQGRIRGVVTQNIDGLHQLAGSRNVLELHGTARKVGCLDCGTLYDANDMLVKFQKTQSVPRCDRCAGLTKHATISFGQALSAEVLRESMRWSREADLYFAIGSSLVVTPAADLPVLAKESGARLVIINREPTPLDSLADVVLRNAIGSCVESVDSKMAATRAQIDAEAP